MKTFLHIYCDPWVFVLTAQICFYTLSLGLPHSAWNRSQHLHGGPTSILYLRWRRCVPLTKVELSRAFLTIKVGAKSFVEPLRPSRGVRKTRTRIHAHEKHLE